MKTLILKDKTHGVQYVTLLFEGKEIRTSALPTLMSDEANLEDAKRIYPDIDWDRIEMINVDVVHKLMDGPSQDQFNKITDLKSFHLRHPDAEMVNTACIHTLGDSVEKFYNSPLYSFFLAEEVLGSKEKALEWYATPIKSLGEKMPIDCTNEEVIQALNAIKHGLYL